MEREKLIKAIGSAVSNLEKSVEALAKRDEKKVLSYVWRAAADSEYALFRLSLMHQEELEGSSWKSRFTLKKVEINPALAHAQDLLKEVRESIEGKDPQEAYKKAWMARGYLLKVQDVFEKRRRDGEKSILPPL